VAFAIWLSTSIFGDNEFGVRFWSPILGAGTSLLLYYFARRLFSEATGFWLVIALNVTPIFNIGSFVMTIDPLSIFFWTAAMYTFWIALERSPAFSWYWPATGALIGIGFLCKYTNALELVSVVLVLALVPRFAASSADRDLHAARGFVPFTIPPIVWNQQHAWATIGHLRSRGSLDDAPGFNPLELLSFLGRALWRLFAAPVSRARVGGDPRMETGAAAVQRQLPAVVWRAGVRVLLHPLDQRSRGAELGCARLSQPRRFRGVILA
jgi:4-amino-4-deoxy-L-arabinose transferase-like glycosyltransferase